MNYNLKVVQITILTICLHLNAQSAVSVKQYAALVHDAMAIGSSDKNLDNSIAKIHSLIKEKKMPSEISEIDDLVELLNQGASSSKYIDLTLDNIHGGNFYVDDENSWQFGSCGEFEAMSSYMITHGKKIYKTEEQSGRKYIRAGILLGIYFNPAMAKSKISQLLLDKETLGLCGLDTGKLKILTDLNSSENETMHQYMSSMVAFEKSIDVIALDKEKTVDSEKLNDALLKATSLSTLLGDCEYRLLSCANDLLDLRLIVSEGGNLEQLSKVDKVITDLASGSKNGFFKRILNELSHRRRPVRRNAKVIEIKDGKFPPGFTPIQSK